ncbi:MAG: formylglycine-generating enzyme family protein [Bacteroidaceae bacterium]|nr:formylglycine-generating enzyme family protein [Bacteroidaceae bacterium]
MKKLFLSLLMLTGIGAMAQVNSCDVNYDNKVNTADVVAIYNNIIDGTTPTKPVMEELNFEINYQGTPLYLVMRPVEGGTFMMGATGEQTQVDDDESPAHLVTLSSYYMEMNELPQAYWEAVMGSNPSSHQHPFYPVENVSWNDCQTFISKLNTMLKDQLPDGMKFRLPTEAEWEFAARGGNKRMGYMYSGSNTLDDVAWYSGNSGGETHYAIALKKGNELGLYDMSGNVWEWCSDWYGEYSSEAQTNPTGPTSGSYRVFRGGSWNLNASGCRSAIRDGSTPTRTGGDLGLRLALGHE